MKPFRLIILAFSLLSAFPTWAHLPKSNGSTATIGVVHLPSAIELRTTCTQGSSSFDLGINNVRARLLICGDAWWDLNSLARYIVPNVPLGSGLPEVSSLFAGAVWLGGKDPAGNLLLAAQTYRSNTRNDFWPGPLDTVGNTTEQVCNDWDKHFSVTAEEISTHIGNWTEANAAGVAYDCSLIPENVRAWPAKGNPYFFEVHNFALPNTNQGLALFFDQDNDGLYNPCNGDYPVIDIRGCELKEYPDQMIFWIYNDNGGIHTQSQGSTPIRMEVQVQAFAYATNDQLNDMTFMRYKLINRSVEELDSTYFAVWTDPDLGCPQDDYIGCDTSRSLAICYNQDNVDGINGAQCTDGIATYGEKIPIIGIDYFRGPRDTYKPILDSLGNPVIDTITDEPMFEEIGMSSFTYYANGAFGINQQTSDPQSAQDFYNYMTGKWRDGTPVTYGGTGYNPSSTEYINYVFPGDPSVAGDWTMCQLDLPGFDGRTVQASGPFKLPSGAINELIIGMPWVPNQNYACPSLAGLQEADDIAQALFDNCFDITDGPDAPCISYVELDRELIIALSNDLTSNNYQQGYQEIDLSAPNTQPDTLYKFEGYIVYQLRDPSVTSFEFNDPDKARIVYQVDLKNDVSTLYNWDGEDVGLAQPAYVPSIQVQAANKGVNNTFRINQDAFALGEVRELKNHKKYYFAAIAYAHNNWKQFDPSDGTGQSRPFLAGRRNIGDKINGADYYTLIPRPITDRVLNASYGSGDVLISRLEGFGTDNNFIDVTDATRESFLVPNQNGTIPYIRGRGPIKVNIYNPLDIKDGEYELTIKDGDPNDDNVSDTSRWILKSLSTNDEIISDATIEGLNEQLLNQYGFSISIAQATEPGQDPFHYESNGYIGTETDYREAATPWLNTITDGPLFLNFLQTGPNELMFGNDPNGVFANPSNLFVPYQLCAWRPPSNMPMIFTPAWQNPQSRFVRDSLMGLSRVNNVDIVFTHDKSKWSRCVVVETTPPFFYGSNANLGEFNIPTIGGERHFDVRRAPSVGKEDANGDGLPDPDGALETFAPFAGQPLNGMGWFPGYAVDVETGRRLNIFFGEATSYNQATFDVLEIDLFQNAPNSRGVAHDMMWNPSSDIQLSTNLNGEGAQMLDIFLGGHQYVYVTDETYDGCNELRNHLDPKFGDFTRKISALKKITWAGVPFLPAGQSFLSYADGLIPNEMVMKLRVENKYNHMLTPSSVHGGNPTYRIKFDGVGATALDAAGLATQLNMINVVPNPYYGYSPYETSQFTTTVKITNLPSVCTVTIYSLDGKFIKQYNRNEGPTATGCSSSAVATRQTVPDLEWDLRNYRNIPIASGVYLINVKAPGVGERTLKWFGTNRQFDPSGL